MGAAKVEPAPLTVAGPDVEPLDPPDPPVVVLELPQAARPIAEATTTARTLIRRMVNFISLICWAQSRPQSPVRCYRRVNGWSPDCEGAGSTSRAACSGKSR